MDKSREQRKITYVLEAVLLLSNGISQFKLITEYEFDTSTVVFAKELMKKIEYKELTTYRNRYRSI